MKAILDASFILDFLLPDEHSSQVTKVFDEYEKKDIDFIAPVILPLEIANGLKYAVKSKRIQKEDAPKFLKQFLKLDIRFVETDLEEAFFLALEKDISIYDATYVYLAQEKNLPLLTLDKRLQKLA